MLVLITYDVNTETAAGKKRLRQVAKQCVNYGRRVQNSVFECILDNAQCVMLKAKLTDIIDEEVDSLRFYYLGNQYKTKVEHIGVDKGIAALTELFNGVRNRNTPVIVERIVADIDSIVKIVRFDGWQNTTAGKQEVKKALRSVVWIKYKIKDKEVFDKAYSYIEQYY